MNHKIPLNILKSSSWKYRDLQKCHVFFLETFKKQFTEKRLPVERVCDLAAVELLEGHATPLVYTSPSNITSRKRTNLSKPNLYYYMILQFR